MSAPTVITQANKSVLEARFPITLAGPTILPIHPPWTGERRAAEIAVSAKPRYGVISIEAAAAYSG